MNKVLLVFLTLIHCLTGSETDAYVKVNPKVQAFVDTYCVSCHNIDKDKGSVRFDNLDGKLKNGTVALLWQDVLDILNTGEMPPEEAKKVPDNNSLAETIGLLTDDLLKARKILNDQGGEVVIRRMNKEEFINSVKFYTGITVPDSMVPLDENSEEEFNTLGSYQTFSPLAYEDYRNAARFAIEKVLQNSVKPNLPPSINKQSWGEQEAKKNLAKHKSEFLKILAKNKTARSLPESARKLPSQEVKTVAYFKKHGFKNKNEYKLSLHDPYKQWELHSYTMNPLASTGILLFNGTSRPKFREVGLTVNNADTKGHYILKIKLGVEAEIPLAERYLKIQGISERFFVAGTPQNPQSMEFFVKADSPLLKIKMETIFRNQELYDKIRQQHKKPPVFWINSMSLEGPFYHSEDEKYAGEILLGKKAASLTDEDAGEIIKSFARRAYRGAEVSTSFSEQLFNIYTDERKRGLPVHLALIQPLSVILSSPTFLYLNEEKNNKSKSSLSAAEFANRLSFMLWKEPPSDELVKNAGRLMEDSRFRNEQIDKMMADKRFDSFSSSFFSQWLYLDKLQHISFDKKKFPNFNEITRREARNQVLAFMKHLLKNDLDLGNVIDSDFTMLNNVMAKHYTDLKLPGLEGLTFDFSPVPLTKSNKHRGGILGMAAIQAMGSNGERTSPVERGAWILRKLLNSPPPPPPPNVPQLKIDDKGLSIREVLNKHMDIPQCKSCHRKIDDMGLAMEEFSLIGKWRSGKNLITAGNMPDGTAFSDYQDMKSKLMLHKDKMIEGMSEALIAYGLSRESEFSDQGFVEDLVKVCRENAYSFKALLKAFIGSKKFMEK